MVSRNRQSGRPSRGKKKASACVGLTGTVNVYIDGVYRTVVQVHNFVQPLASVRVGHRFGYAVGVYADLFDVQRLVGVERLRVTHGGVIALGFHVVGRQSRMVAGRRERTRIVLAVGDVTFGF